MQQKCLETDRVCTHTLKASFGMGWLLRPRLTSPGPLWELAPGISQLSHCNPEGLRGGEPSFPSASSTFLCFPSWSLGAWRTSHRDTCIAGDWNGDKAYGEERDGGKGITAAGERGPLKGSSSFPSPEITTGMRHQSEAECMVYPDPLSQSPECQQEALEKPESGKSSSWYVFKRDRPPPGWM